MAKLRKKAGITSATRIKVPKMSEDQIESAKKNCRKLYRMSIPSGGDYFSIIDDETYMELDPQEANKKQYFSIVPGYEIDEKDKVVQKSKLPARMMVWQAIAEDGRLSPAYVCKINMNGEVYREECLKKILLPWIRSLTLTRPVLFWPDKASSHYSRIAIEFLKENNIRYVSKADNPTSVPSFVRSRNFGFIVRI